MKKMIIAGICIYSLGMVVGIDIGVGLAGVVAKKAGVK